MIQQRLHFSWVSASEGKKWVTVVDGVIDAVRAKGPFTQFKRLNKEIEIPVTTGEGVSTK